MDLCGPPKMRILELPVTDKAPEALEWSITSGTGTLKGVTPQPALAFMLTVEAAPTIVVNDIATGSAIVTSTYGFAVANEGGSGATPGSPAGKLTCTLK